MMCVFCLSGTFFDDGNHQVIFIKVVEVAGSGMCSKHHGSGVLCGTTLYASMTTSMSAVADGNELHMDWSSSCSEATDSTARSVEHGMVLIITWSPAVLCSTCAFATCSAALSRDASELVDPLGLRLDEKLMHLLFQLPRLHGVVFQALRDVFYASFQPGEAPRLL